MGVTGGPINVANEYYVVIWPSKVVTGNGRGAPLVVNSDTTTCVPGQGFGAAAGGGRRLWAAGYGEVVGAGEQEESGAGGLR